MKIKINKFHQLDGANWDDFVDQANNGTIFHFRKFLNYHINRTFKDHSLIFRKHDRIIALFPAAELIDETKNVLFSHPGVSFGGFVFDKMSYSDAVEIIDVFIDYCLSHKFNKTFLVPTPNAYLREQNDIFEYALLWKKFRIVENYISSIIELTPPINEIFSKIYRNKNRTKSYFQNIVSKNKLRFEWNNNFNEFYPILVDNKNRHNSKPTHSFDELLKLNKLFPNQIKLLMMYKNDNPIGGTLNFVANERVVIIFYNMIDHKYSNLHPATLQVMETIKWALNSGFKRLDFGVSQDPLADDPLTPAPKLIRFKEELTGRGMVRRAYAKKFES